MKYQIKGKDLSCHHCDNDEFTQTKAQLNTAGLSFLGLEWLNRSSIVYTCCECGRIEWFTEPESTKNNLQSDSRCMSCSEVIPAGRESCEKCGWTYK